MLDLEKMRHSGAILSKTLDYLTSELVKPGVSTKQISEAAYKYICSHKDCKPAFLGYHGFTGSACISLNNQAVHGVPRDDTIVEEGDLVSIDCGVNYQGHFSDACRTVIVGEVTHTHRRLVEETDVALSKGISAALPGNKVGDISYSIQRHIERKGFCVSLDLVGHGIGHVLHGDPKVPNYGPPGTGPDLYVGMCLAIEPVVFNGPSDCLIDYDGWTIVSKHGNFSAHFEDTVIITEEGPEVITRVN